MLMGEPLVIKTIIEIADLWTDGGQTDDEITEEEEKEKEEEEENLKVSEGVLTFSGQD